MSRASNVIYSYLEDPEPELEEEPISEIIDVRVILGIGEGRTRTFKFTNYDAARDFIESIVKPMRVEDWVMYDPYNGIRKKEISSISTSVYDSKGVRVS